MVIKMKKTKTQIEFEKIPENVRKKYEIELDKGKESKRKNKIYIFEPAYISIGNPTVNVGNCVVDIGNSKISVSLWKTVKNMHVTIY